MWWRENHDDFLKLQTHFDFADISPFLPWVFFVLTRQDVRTENLRVKGIPAVSCTVTFQFRALSLFLSFFLSHTISKLHESEVWVLPLRTASGSFMDIYVESNGNKVIARSAKWGSFHLCLKRFPPLVTQHLLTFSFGAHRTNLSCAKSRKWGIRGGETTPHWKPETLSVLWRTESTKIRSVGFSFSSLCAIRNTDKPNQSQ